MNDIMKIVQALENSNILLKKVTKTIENESRNQKGVFLRLLLGTLASSLLSGMLTGKCIVRKGYGSKKGERTKRSGEVIKNKAVMPPHHLTKFEIEEYYENEP